MQRHVAALSVAVVGFLAASAFAQPGPPGGGGFGFGGDWLLRNEAVAKELELVDGQLEKIEAAQAKMRDQLRELYSGLRDVPEAERRERFEGLREKSADLQKKLQEELDGILLPQQRDRLNQIRVQMEMRSRGGASLTGGRLAEQLGLSEAQTEKLRAREEELREEMTEKIRKLQEESREKLLQELTPEQRKKLNEMIGTPFELPRPQGGPGGGFRGRRPGGSPDA